MATTKKQATGTVVLTPRNAPRNKVAITTQTSNAVAVQKEMARLTSRARWVNEASSSREMSSSSTAPSSSRVSRNRARSTTRESRFAITPSIPPIAESRKTGAIDSWMTCEIAEMFGSPCTG